MEQLDRVYETFTNLERNYARSKKTREQYLIDKFGGDINVGSFLIMHSLTMTELTNPEDIDKLSTIRRIFSIIKDKQRRLSSITSLDFLAETSLDEFTDALDLAEERGTGIHIVPQAELFVSKRSPAHYAVSVGETTVAAFNECRYFNCDNPALRTYSQTLVKERVPSGAIVERSSLTEGHIVTRPDFWS